MRLSLASPRRLRLLGATAATLLACLAALVHLRHVAAEADESPLRLMDLSPGTQLVGTAQFGTDLAHPSLRFTAQSGQAYVQDCATYPIDGCTTLAFELAFAVGAKQLDVPDTQLHVLSGGNNQKAVVLTRGTQPYLVFKS